MALMGFLPFNVAYAWTNPTSPPPQSGSAAVMVEQNTPSKTLYLKLNTGTAVGNIGIGTMSPAYPLDVNGIINSTGLYVNGSPYIGSQWITSSSTIYYSGGNVGIATTTPDQALSVNGNAHIIGLSNDNGLIFADGTKQVTASFGGTTTLAAGNVSSGTFGSNASYGYFRFANAGGTEIMYIDSASGRVGIGLTNPAYKLDVTGDINISSGSGLRMNGTATSGQYLRGDGTRFVSSAIQSSDLPSVGTAGTYGSATVVPIVTTDAQGRVSGVATSTISGVVPGGSAGGALTGTYPNPTLLNLSTVGAVPYVSSSGVLNQNASNFFWDNTNARLGIATTTPDQALTVYGNTHITGSGNGLIFVDGTKQTTAYAGGSQTITAGNITPGIFASNATYGSYYFNQTRMIFIFFKSISPKPN